MFLSWIVFPLVALVACLGLGLLVDWLSGRVLAPVLVLPVGGAALVCLTQLTTISSATAPSTVWVVVAASVAGLVLGRTRVVELREAKWAGAAALVVFLVVSMPVLATGSPSFAGYTVLGDTALHLAGAQEMPERARDASSLPPSAYAFAFQSYYDDNAYPAGGATALGALARLVPTDLAWLFQPFLSVMLVLLTLAIAGLAQPVLGSARKAALVAVVAAQPALLVAFVMQGSIKEVVVSVMLATLAATIPAAAAAGAEWRAAVPVTVAAAAAVGALGPSAVLWAGPLVLGFLVLAALAGRSSRELAGPTAIVVLVGAVLASQSLVLLSTATSVATSVATAGEAGNLLRALALDQSLGVWLTGDFRTPPTGTLLIATRIGEVAVLIAAGFGVAWCIGRRAWVPLLYGATMVLGAIFVLARGSLWADAKALVIVSPAILTIAMLGITGHLDRHRAVALTGAAAVLLGVLASNVLIYRSSSIAPQDRLAELAELGDELAGEGPVLVSEFEEFGPYFLREARPERGPLVVTSPGDTDRTQRAAAADLDGMTPENLAGYPVLITRRGPIGSRPSSLYERAGGTEHYDVWRRTGDPASLLGRIPLGDGPRSPSSVMSCDQAREVARNARQSGGRIVVAEAPQALTVNPARDDRPSGWRRDRDDPVLTLPAGGGSASASLQVPAAGRYGVWLEGSIGRATAVEIDGETVGVLRNRLAGRRVAEQVGEVELAAGPHTVTVERRGAGLAPGSGGLFRPLGLVYRVGESPAVSVRAVAAADWRELCARPLDWVEVVA